ncbi:UPF0236 family transposase-like protein [Spiroplasma endosymbiont of Seladonia tumulorum]|uniref:UPF0236 family transposase-like protein n=1 Tax=Spiroplasma endosymbiont of Seladonia tumulorum TaxID=3066321 RepID=UPI0030CC860B
MKISNVIRKCDIEYFSSHLFNEFEKIKLEENSCLYIFMDEGFVSLKEDKQIKDFRCRITTFNTGFNFKKCKYNRKVLANKRGFVILKEQKTGEINTEDYVQRILMELERYYILPEKFKIIVSGDGDGWIIQTTSFLGAKYVLDRFHFSKELKRAF